MPSVTKWYSRLVTECPTTMNKDSRIFVAGHKGLVGGALLRRLQREGFRSVLTTTRKETDLTCQADVDQFFSSNEPEIVFLAAARVGGILANASYPADFIRDNLLIQTNVIDAAYQNGAEKLVFLGSSCIYPKLAEQPISEDTLLTGPLEPTNQAYAIAKISGIEMCRSYRNQHGFDAISVMPTNLYGPGDNFDLEGSHVLPALIRKFHEAYLTQAEDVVIWGTGKPRREFLHVDDLASALLYLAENYSQAGPINVGVGRDISISELAQLVSSIVGFKGKLVYDTSKPDGTPRKLLDVTRLTDLGWRPRIGLAEGIRTTYSWFVNQYL